MFDGSESENEFAASDVEIVGDEVTHPSVGDRERSGATGQREAEREENCVGAATRLESVRLRLSSNSLCLFSI